MGSVRVSLRHKGEEYSSQNRSPQCPRYRLSRATESLYRKIEFVQLLLKHSTTWSIRLLDAKVGDFSVCVGEA